MTDALGRIPFEAQAEPRGCGAACLAMIYRSLGRTVPQADIWPRIARRNAFGSVASTTHLMACDAIERGNTAVIVQTRDKIESLRVCSEAGCRTILALRLAPNASAGHYVVLLDVTPRTVALHDPLAGPGRVLPHDELLALWDKPVVPSEMGGGVLIAIGPKEPGEVSCGYCRSPVPEAITCPSCREPVGLRPLAAVGCVAASCPGRLWAGVCCPKCNLMWDGGSQAEPAPEPAIDLGKVFGALDKFEAVAVGVPGVAAHPDFSRIMGQLGQMRGVLTQAVAAEAAARARLEVERQAAAAGIAANIAAMRAKMPPPAEPGSTTLDAVELGRALLDRLAAHPAR
jgi:hypothetical protein